MISDPPGPISNKLSSFVWKYPLPVASCDKWKQISEVVRSTTPSCPSKNATRGDEIATSRSLPRYARLKKRSGALAMCSGAFQKSCVFSHEFKNMDVWETFITNGCVNKFFVPKDPYMLRNTCPETGEFSGCCNESGIGGAALRPKKRE